MKQLENVTGREPSIKGAEGDLHPRFVWVRQEWDTREYDVFMPAMVSAWYQRAWNDETKVADVHYMDTTSSWGYVYTVTVPETDLVNASVWAYNGCRKVDEEVSGYEHSFQRIHTRVMEDDADKYFTIPAKKVWEEEEVADGD